MIKTHIKIATRKSKLALWQANFVKTALEKQYPILSVELVEIVTEGDEQQHIPLAQIGGKAMFVKALQNALFQHTADIAVHSMKDLSAHDTAGLQLATVCERADARDAWVSNHYATIAQLPKAAIVGTSSPRRSALLKSLRPDVIITLLRGNVDTRLSKLDAAEYDAIILAAAGLTRLGLSARICDYLSEDIFTPAIAQGAIGIECRAEDKKIQGALKFLHHTHTAQCVIAERTVNQILNGDCHTAIGAHAKIIHNQLHLSAMVANPDGSIILRAQHTGHTKEPEKCGEIVANALMRQGAESFIRYIS